MSAAKPSLLSVIVPVAMGREPYTKLFSWLPTVAGRDLEVIVVLDAFAHSVSPKFLGAINNLESSQLKVIQGSFGSPGKARNFGLAHATGTWVTFWDSDDLPNIDAFLEMVAQAHSQKFEVAVGSFTWHSDTEPREAKTFINPENINELISSIGRTPGIWRFAAKRELIEAPFSTLQMAEDQDFLLANKFLSRKVFISTENVYEYFTGSGIHQTSSPENFKDLRIALQLTYRHFTNASDKRIRELSAAFWFQQFGSNLKYGSGLSRVKTLLIGVRRLIISPPSFKKSIVSIILSRLSTSGPGKEDYKVIVPLTGGLGNQLFQLSAALALADGAKVGLDTSIGAPRVNANGDPEIASFKLPRNVVFLPTTKRSKLIKKASGYMLRIGVSPKKFESFSLYRRIFNLLWNILMVLNLKKFIMTTSGQGVGYFQMKKLKFKQFIYGYFQSYIWPEQSLEQLRQIHPVNQSPILEQYRALAKVELPLIVHIRLGDYKLENNFGIPSKRYYSEALSQLWELDEYKKIWVFSDEPDAAAQYLPLKYLSSIRWMPEIENSAALTLETMRLGTGYVIGNSTFSWWGAFLAYNSNVQVIAPRPWFKFGESPQALIPPGWKQVDAFKN